jgi:hypothetical protein
VGKDLYIVGDPSGPVKIGVANDVASRMAALQTGNPRRLVLLDLVPDCGYLELALHRAFEQFRLVGEWFDFGRGRDPVAVVRDMISTLTSQG